jgi:hypothetical protein
MSVSRLGIARCLTIGISRATTRYCFESSITTPVLRRKSDRRKANCSGLTFMGGLSAAGSSAPSLESQRYLGPEMGQRQDRIGEAGPRHLARHAPDDTRELVLDEHASSGINDRP